MENLTHAVLITRTTQTTRQHEQVAAGMLAHTAQQLASRIERLADALPRLRAWQVGVYPQNRLPGDTIPPRLSVGPHRRVGAAGNTAGYILLLLAIDDTLAGEVSHVWTPGQHEVTLEPEPMLPKSA